MRKNLPILVLFVTDISRIWSHIQKSGSNNCWEWSGYKREGYGRIRIREISGISKVL